MYSRHSGGFFTTSRFNQIRRLSGVQEPHLVLINSQRLPGAVSALSTISSYSPELFPIVNQSKLAPGSFRRSFSNRSGLPGALLDISLIKMGSRIPFAITRQSTVTLGSAFLAPNGHSSETTPGSTTGRLSS